MYYEGSKMQERDEDRKRYDTAAQNRPIGIPTPTKVSPALERLHTKLANAIAPALESTAVIENKLHAILNLNFPKASSDEYPMNKTLDQREFTNGGAISELEETILKAHLLTERLQIIVKHLHEII